MSTPSPAVLLPYQLHDDAKQALERLIGIAQGASAQARPVANFLLAWRDAAACGGFDLTDLWRVDLSTAVDMVKIFIEVLNSKAFPEALDPRYMLAFERVYRLHRAKAAEGGAR